MEADTTDGIKCEAGQTPVTIGGDKQVGVEGGMAPLKVSKAQEGGGRVAE